ncbi:MAG TPA: serine/threonine-protein kinase [Myxococcaceae bacterium]|jgi:tetratricopeptide (TPR) repeat protein/tRNA A-37 threonylcarbamoyl transferase component Bud32
MCPSDNELVALAQGELPPPDVERVTSHARGCAACRSTLSKLSGPGEDDDERDDSGEVPSGAGNGKVTPAATGDIRGGHTLPVLPDGTPSGSDDDEAEPLERGAAVGRYDILQHLASGGMGAVYAAYDPQLDRRVALKVLAQRGRSEVSRERLQLRLQREAQAMARLTHPNVVAVHDVGTFQGRVFLAMEFVDGVNLKDWLRERKRSWQEVRDLFVQAGRGLAAAHAVGLIHRDFKPDNVLIGKDGRARVADFGLARPMGESRHEDTEERTGSVELALLDTPLTLAGTIMGTPRYMAPEQMRAETTDERTDQFSMAVALYDALYGVRPFEPKTLAERLVAIEDGKIQAPPAGHGVPEWLGQAVRRALSAEPPKRFPTMDAFLDALQQDARKGKVNARLAGAVLGVGALAAAGMFALRPDLRCKGSERRLEGAWDADRRAAMRRAFSALPDGEAQFQRATGVLDDYGRRWAAMRDDACAATRIRGDQPESVMALRMECLDLRLHELQYLTALMATADQKLVDRAVDAASGLSSVRSCADTSSLGQGVPLPDDPQAREAIQKLKQTLAEVNALLDAGRYKVALEKVAAVVDRARDLKYKPVEAEALLVQGTLLNKTGETARGAEVLRAAALAADAGRVDRVRARAATEAVFSLALGQDYARGEEWAAQAQAVLDRTGGNAEGQADLLVNLGTLHAREGQNAMAATVLESGRRFLTSELGRDDPRTLNATGNLAMVYQRLGRLEEAITLLDETIASTRRRLGPDHPDLRPRYYATALVQIERHDFGSAHKNIDEALRIARKHMGEQNVTVANTLDIKATIYQEEHRYQDALATYQRSLEIKQQVLAPDDQIVSYSFDGIGQSLLGLGRPEEARPMLEKALAIRGKDPVDLADTQYALARALWQLGQQKAAALKYGEQALKNYQSAGKAERAVEVEGWLAKRR